MEKKNEISFNTIEDVNKVVNLKNLKLYIDKFGCSEQIQNKLGLPEHHIMMLAKIDDINEYDGRSVPLGEKIIKYIKKHPDITQSEMQQYFNMKKAEIIYAQIFPYIHSLSSYYKFDDDNNKHNEYSICHNDSVRKNDAERKNKKLIKQYNKAIDNYCGVGTKRVKKMLTRLSKDGDINAKLYLTAFKAEEQNIAAKTSSVKKIRNNVYKKKSELVMSLIELCRDNDIVYGYQNTDNYSANTVVYFELPHMEQISFHMNMGYKTKKTIPKYKKEWDEQVNSTLRKIEKVLKELYADELLKVKEHIPEEKEEKRENKRKHKESVRAARLKRQQLRELKKQNENKERAED